MTTVKQHESHVAPPSMASLTSATTADNKVYALRSLRCRGSSGARVYATKIAPGRARMMCILPAAREWLRPNFGSEKSWSQFQTLHCAPPKLLVNPALGEMIMKTKTLKTILCLSFACLSCEPKIETAYIKASKAKIFDSNGKVAGYLPYGYSVKGAYSFQKFVISREGLYLQKQDTTIEEKNIKDPQLYMQLKYDTGDMAANINKTDMKFFRDQMTYFEYWRYAPSGDMRKIEGRGKTEFDGGDIKITYSGEKFEGQEFDQEYGKRNAFRNTKLHLKFINTLGIYVEQSQKSKIDRVTCKIDTKTCEVQCNKFIGPLEANSEINSRYQACLKSDGDTDCDDVIYDKIHGYCIQ